MAAGTCSVTQIVNGICKIPEGRRLHFESPGKKLLTLFELTFQFFCIPAAVECNLIEDLGLLENPPERVVLDIPFEQEDGVDLPVLRDFNLVDGEAAPDPRLPKGI